MPTDSKICAAGLTSDQVRERTETGRTNHIPHDGEVTLGKIIRSNTLTYFNLIFLVITILLVIVGAFKNLTFLPVVIGNTAIGIVQQWVSKKTLDKVTILSSPKTSVIRDGRRQTVRSEDLVIDDTVALGAGDQVPADGIVIAGEASVNESLLTGEQNEVPKMAGDGLLSGSFVVSGEVTARLTKVGADSFASRLTSEARKFDEGQQSEMIRSLDILVRVIGILLIPLGILLFWQMYRNNGLSFRDSVVGMCAAVIGMVPEGLYLLSSVTMATSTAKLAMQKVLVHDMRSIESLARADVLCLDKTGTITESEVCVTEVLPLTEGEWDSEDGEKKRRRILLDIGDYAAGQSPDNATMKAMQAYFTENSGKKADIIVPFSPVYKYSAAVFGGRTFICGAPEFLLCEDGGALREKIGSLAEEGKRVMLFGVIDGILEDGILLPQDCVVEPVCLIIAENPVRKNAAETFRYFAQQNVSVRVISGDNPLTVSKVAQQAGIEGAERYADASAMSDEQLEACAADTVVFGRVSPDQKRTLVAALQKQGHRVAMTGDGVNDVLALKDADCSIAMASGAQAAEMAAQMVLLDSDFARMPSVVAEGRRVVNNITRTATLFLVKNIFSLLMSVFSILFLVSYPLQPTQISLVSAFTIGIPAFLLSFESSDTPITGKFIRNVLFHAFPAGITDFLTISALVMFCDVFEVGDADVSTSCAILLIVVGLLILYRTMEPMNGIHMAIWLGMIGGLLAAVLLFHDIFLITVPTQKVMLLTILFAVAAEPCLRYLTRLFELCSRLGHSAGRKREQRRQRRKTRAEKS